MNNQTHYGPGESNHDHNGGRGGRGNSRGRGRGGGRGRGRHHHNNNMRYINSDGGLNTPRFSDRGARGKKSRYKQRLPGMSNAWKCILYTC